MHHTSTRVRLQLLNCAYNWQCCTSKQPIVEEIASSRDSLSMYQMNHRVYFALFSLFSRMKDTHRDTETRNVPRKGFSSTWHPIVQIHNWLKWYQITSKQLCTQKRHLPDDSAVYCFFTFIYFHLSVRVPFVSLFIIDFHERSTLFKMNKFKCTCTVKLKRWTNVRRWLPMKLLFKSHALQGHPWRVQSARCFIYVNSRGISIILQLSLLL